jgi:hypothetical protein
MKALSLSPEARHPTALALAVALERAAGYSAMPIATSRAVTAFVKELGAHKPVVVPPAPELPAAPPPAPAPAPQAAERAAPVAAVAPPQAPAESTHVSSVVSTRDAATPKRFRAIAVLAAAVVVLVIGLWLNVTSLGSRAPTPSLAASTGAADSAAPVTVASTPSPPAVVAAASVVPPPTTASPPPAAKNPLPKGAAKARGPRADEWRPGGL